MEFTTLISTSYFPIGLHVSKYAEFGNFAHGKNPPTWHFHIQHATVNFFAWFNSQEIYLKVLFRFKYNLASNSRYWQSKSEVFNLFSVLSISTHQNTVQTWRTGLFCCFRMKFNMWSTDIVIMWWVRPPHIGTRKKSIHPPVLANRRKKSKMAAILTPVPIHKNGQWSAPSFGLYICSPINLLQSVKISIF